MNSKLNNRPSRGNKVLLFQHPCHVSEKIGIILVLPYIHARIRGATSVNYRLQSKLIDLVGPYLNTISSTELMPPLLSRHTRMQGDVRPGVWTLLCLGANSKRLRSRACHSRHVSFSIDFFLHWYSMRVRHHTFHNSPILHVFRFQLAMIPHRV